MTPFNIIVAVDSKNGIGKDGRLPWHLPGELRHFKEITSQTGDPSKQNAVVMGRKTWESIPDKFRPLSKRLNILLTRNHGFTLPLGVEKFKNLDEALFFVDKNKQTLKIESVFIIGGGEVFRQSIIHNKCQKIFLTKIDHDFSCDVFLPIIPKGFQLAAESIPSTEAGLSYRFCEYVKR